MRKAIAALAVTSIALLTAVQAQTTQSVWNGIYTEDQAARGAQNYVQVCAACHGATLGGSGEAPALSGGQFIGDFDGQTVGDVFDRIRTTMPQSAPGVLSREQYADILAFLLKSNGFPAGKTELIGICGGYQMLGAEISDPHGIESAGQTTRGLGLLALSTVMAREKTLRRVSAKHTPSGLSVHGYEIHHGQSAGDALEPILFRDDGEQVGSGAAGGLTWGTYLHGVFDADEFRRWFLDRLRVRRGLPAVGKVCASYDLEPAFERLAAVVRENLNVPEIYRLMGLR